MHITIRRKQMHNLGWMMTALAVFVVGMALFGDHLFDMIMGEDEDDE